MSSTKHAIANTPRKNCTKPHTLRTAEAQHVILRGIESLHTHHKGPSEFAPGSVAAGGLDVSLCEGNLVRWAPTRCKRVAKLQKFWHVARPEIRTGSMARHSTYHSGHTLSSTIATLELVNRLIHLHE